MGEPYNPDFEAAMLLEPLVVIVVTGGCVTKVMSNTNTNFAVIDYDRPEDGVPFTGDFAGRKATAIAGFAKEDPKAVYASYLDLKKAGLFK